MSYPFEYDTRQKKDVLLDLLRLNLFGCMGAFIVLIGYELMMGGRLSLEGRSLAWVAIGVAGLHASLVQGPAVYLAMGLDKKTNQVLSRLQRDVANSLYGPDRAGSLARIRTTLEANRALIQEYGVYDLLFHYADESLDYSLQEIGAFSLQRLDVALSALRQLRSPFAPLNFIMSTAGLTALVGIALSLKE